MAPKDEGGGDQAVIPSCVVHGLDGGCKNMVILELRELLPCLAVDTSQKGVIPLTNAQCIVVLYTRRVVCDPG